MKRLLSYLTNDAPLLWLAPLVLLLFLLLFPENARPAPALEFLIFCAILLLFYIAFLLLRGAVIRRRFLRRLTRLCRERGYILERPKGSASLVIRTEAHTYSCVLVGSLRYRTPILFSENEASYAHLWGIRTPGKAEARYNLRTQSFTATVKKDYLFAIARKKPLAFPAEGIRRAVIVNPCPRRVLCGTADQYTYVPPGDTVNDYLVFSGSSFCRMLACQGDVFDPHFARRGEL